MSARPRPITAPAEFYRTTGLNQKRMLEAYCSDKSGFLEEHKATMTHTYYNSAGEWLTSFSIGPEDCQVPKT
jgi:hypothetical protein